MQKYIWGTLYFLLLLIDIYAIFYKVDLLRYITKPSLMISLALYYWMQVGHTTYRSRNIIFLALVFSWWGDIMLLINGTDSTFFMLGLSSFLLAHIMYTIFFIQSRLPKSIVNHNNLWYASFVLLYAVSLVAFLYPHLGNMALPVIIYAIAITVMLMSCIFSYAHLSYDFVKFLLTGAILFVLSDSILAYDRFYQPVKGGGIFIMLSYGLAQWCLVEGASKYLKRAW